MITFLGVLSGFVRNTLYFVACLSPLGFLTLPAIAQAPPQVDQASQSIVVPKQAIRSVFQKYHNSMAEVHPEVNPQLRAAQRTKQGSGAAAAQREVQKPNAAAKAQQTYYDVNAVNKQLTTLKQNIVAVIPQDDAPLRRYIDEQFPKTLSGTDGYVTLQQWDEANTQAYSLHTKFDEMESLKVDFKINSSPDNATFTYFAYLEAPASISTNDTITKMWRGTYDYKVEMKGFVSIEGTFNTVELAFTTLECTLAVEQEGAASDRGRCVLK
jgi:hypothetical protein